MTKEEKFLKLVILKNIVLSGEDIFCYQDVNLLIKKYQAYMIRNYDKKIDFDEFSLQECIDEFAMNDKENLFVAKYETVLTLPALQKQLTKNESLFFKKVLMGYFKDEQSQIIVHNKNNVFRKLGKEVDETLQYWEKVAASSHLSEINND